MSDASGWQVQSDAPRHYEEQVLRFMKPFADALVAAVVQPSDSVLDVACGTGIATRVAAGVVGPDGDVVGSDINRPMLEFARQMSDIHRDGITWNEASAMGLPFSEGQFDKVICQQGVQFFPEPSMGLREMVRVARPGGAIAFTVWTPIADSPYFGAMHSMLAHYCGADADALAWFADELLLNEWLDDAGVRERTVHRHVATVKLPPLGVFVPAHMQATPWADEFKNLTPQATSAAIDEMERHLAQSRASTSAGTNFSSHLVTVST